MDSLVPIGSLIDQLMQEYRKDGPSVLERICQCWSDAVGEDAAREAKPCAIKGEMLLVHVSSPVWVHHLHFQKQDILKRLHESGASVTLTDIKFKIGSV
jgi:predicted nucleic acid-binding Zn ribbon protein